MKLNGNIPIDDGNPYKKLRKAHKNSDIGNKNNASKSEDSRDKISLSGRAIDINELKKLIHDLPEMRSDRIDALKKAIDSGNYNIDVRKIAEKMLEEL